MSPDAVPVRVKIIPSTIINAPKPAKISIGEGESRMGGGTMPKSAIPSKTIDILPDNLSLPKLAKRLREADNPVMGYIADEKFRIDLRTIFPRQDQTLISSIARALAEE